MVPQVAVRPRDIDEVLATVASCREAAVPLTARGAGTSIAGNAVGTGVVMDLRRHLNAIRSLDAEMRTATVEPGTVPPNYRVRHSGTSCGSGRTRPPTAAAP
ncbi:FAD-binding oxidoreductase [Streptomyces sp. NPDC059893]|uniref:FAD-binding oxidoreductase n=1 Tax=Streptomyces sp. NPDC059893 TaxID=3346990 RepID=UPI0036664D61